MRLRQGPLLAALCLGAAGSLLWYAVWPGGTGESCQGGWRGEGGAAGAPRPDVGAGDTKNPP